jgi:hypothetical protein
MSKVKILFIALLCCMARLYGNNIENGGFKLVKKDNIISLYERWFVNTQGENVRELKAVLQVRSDIPEIISLLADSMRGTKWNIHAVTYNIHGGGASWITYLKYAIPWPFGDQDCCLFYSLKQGAVSQKYALLNFESTTHQQYPEQKNITRITGIKGKWELQGTEKGHVRVTYLISSNRNTRLPRWISDPIVRNNLFDTMSAFKNILES